MAATPPDSGDSQRFAAESRHLEGELLRLVQSDGAVVRFLFAEAFDGMSLRLPGEAGPEWRSPALAEALGYSAEEVPSAAAWWRERLTPESREQADANWTEHREASAAGYEETLAYRCRDGSTVWLRSRYLIRGTGVIGVHRDVSADRRPAAEARSGRGAPAHSCFEIDPLSGLVLACDEALASTLERERGSMVGRPWSDFVDNGVRAVLTQVISEVVDGNQVPPVSVDLVRADGAPVSALAQVSRLTYTDGRSGVCRVDCWDARDLQSVQSVSALIEALPHGAFAIDEVGRVIATNEAAEKLAGRSRRELEGRLVKSVVRTAPHDRAGAARAEDESARGPQVATTALLERPDGELAVMTRWTRVARGGLAVRLLHVVHDGERQAVDKALKESEARFRLICDASPELIWTCDATGVCDYLSAGWAAYTGASRDDLIPDGVFDYLHKDDREAVAARWMEAVKSGEPYSDEFRLLGSNGVYHWFQARAQPHRDPKGRIKRWIGSTTDIDHYKASVRSSEAQDARRTLQLEGKTRELLAAKRSLEAVLEAASLVAIISTDLEGSVTVFNRGAERMLGYRADELIDIEQLTRVHLETELAHRSVELSEAYGRRVSGFDVLTWRARHGREDEHEWTYVRKDGTRLDVRVAVTAMHDADEQLMGFLFVASDITSTKALFAELRATNRTLEKATRDAQEASLAKTEFLATMSHEIRTPMNAILGMSELLLETSLTPTQRQYAVVVRRACSNLAALINDILDLSKIESGSIELEEVELDLRTVIQQASDLVSPRLRGDAVTLHTFVDPDVPPRFIGDPTRLQQILNNLLSNAAKFTHEGRITISVENEPAAGASKVRFTVADTGVGIPKEKINLIFENFAQADSSVTRRYGGTGLGLGIARKLVHCMGGELTVESEPGRGSAFSFSVTFGLPSVLGPGPAVLEGLAGVRALVVDGDEANRRTYATWLRRIELVVDEADSAAECMSRVRSAGEEGNPHGVILFDVRLPEGDGWERLKRVREQAPASAVIVLGPEEASDGAARARELGCAGYAPTPVARNELHLYLARALSQADGAASSSVPEPEQDAEDAQRLAAKTVAGDSMLLVVEDSEDNQILIEAYLKGSEFGYELAENGQEAFDLYRANDYELVLMDMQMPVMDGLTATRKIRELEAATERRRTPILALSANAFEQDREQSLAAGCEEHLAKPVERESLLGAIRRHACSPAVVVDAPSGMEGLAAEYLERRRREVADFEALLDGGELDRIRTMGHNMKGSATGYGFPALASLGASLERCADAGEVDDLRLEIGRLARYLSRVSLGSPSMEMK